MILPTVRNILLVTLIFCLSSPSSFSSTKSESQLPTNKLVDALKTGGHIIYMRHAKTNHSEKDHGVDRLKNCSQQRNLSQQGRDQATEIGKVLKSLEIPVSEVLSSPYCRCKETAKLAFGKLEVVKDLQFSISKSKEESEFLGKRLKSIMLEANTNTGNVVIVGHTSNLRDGLGVWPKPEGVIAVFKNNKGEISFKGMIPPEVITSF